MEVFDQTLQLQSGQADVTRGLLALNTAQDLFEALIASRVLREIRERVKFLSDVGVGYLTLNRSAATLSGGEAQRVKLALELSKRDTGRTLYVLDEPTTGLHFADIDAGDGRVKGIRTSQQLDMWINGGYFILKPEVFSYMREGEELVEAPFRRLIENGLGGIMPARNLRTTFSATSACSVK